jgi:hypothetical protein
MAFMYTECTVFNCFQRFCRGLLGIEKKTRGYRGQRKGSSSFAGSRGGSYRKDGSRREPPGSHEVELKITFYKIMS